MGKRITEYQLKQCIEHYERMIGWAKTQPEDYVPNLKEMENELGETWYGNYCYLCKRYYPKSNPYSTFIFCFNCPLYENGYGCNDYGSRWRILCCSLTWKEWIENAKKMIAIFRSLPVEKSYKK